MLIDPAFPAIQNPAWKGGVERLRSLAFWAFAGALVTASFSNSFFEIFSGAYLILALTLVMIEKRAELFKNKPAIFAGLYLLAVILSLLQSQYWDNSSRGVFRVLRCILMCFFAPAVVDSPKRFRTAFYVTAAAALLVGLDACLQAASGFDLIRGRTMTPYTGQAGRVTGPFRHANDFSAYLSLAIFLFLGMIPHAFKQKIIKKEIFFAGGAAVLGLCLLWTYARGAWVAVIMAFVLMALFKKDRLMILAMIVCLALAFLFSPPTIRTRVFSFGDMKNGTLTERRLLWDESLRMIRQRPWLGYGINTYSKVEPQFKSLKFYTDNQYAHNGYLQIAAETGLLGLGAFLSFILSFFVIMGRSLLPEEKGFVGAGAASLLFGILAFLLHSATDTDLHSLRLVSFLWLCMGWVMAAKKIADPPDT